MVREIIVQQTEDPATATLPREVVERLHVAAGDRVFAIETERGVLFTPYDPLFDEAMRAFEQVRREYRNTLRKLGE